MAEVLVRTATASDLHAITSIYAHHVRYGTATFEVDPPAQSEMERRWQGIQTQGLPYLVIENESGVIGYAYAARYRPRPAYRFTVEDSIYIHPEFRGRGLGGRLLARLIEICVTQARRQMIAIIGDSANTASIRLHAKFAFHTTGVLKKVGRKFGRWIDTVIMQRELATDRRLSVLEELAKSSQSRIATLQQVADFIRTAGDYRWVGLYDNDGAQIRNLVFSGSGAPAYPVFPADRGLTGIAVRERRTVNVGDVAVDPRYLTAFGTTRSEIIVPICDRERKIVLGTIDVESEKVDAFSERDQIFLEDCSELLRSLWESE